MPQSIKKPPAMQETQVRFLVLEDPLEEGMATHSSILARRIPGTEKSNRLHTVHRVTSRTQLKQLSTHAHTHTLIFRRIFNISIFEYKFRQDLTESELSEARLLPACLTTLCSSSFQDLAGGLGYRINLGYKAETK